MYKKILEMLGKAIEESVKEDVEKCDESVQDLFEASQKFIKRNLTKLSYEDLEMASAISKSLASTIKYAYKIKKEKEEEDEE